MTSRVRDALERLGAHRDNAWHTLVELGPVALEDVIEAYRKTNDLEKKIALVTVVSEYRTAGGLDFLREVLSASNDELWKAALDGLVTLGGRDARAVLMVAAASATSDKRDWILEAIDQIADGKKGSQD